MGYPTLTFEVGFAAGPRAALSGLVWTDVTTYVRSFRISRGRAHELSSVEAGLCDMVLLNTDRRFDPLHSAGPYFGSLLPGRRLRVTAVWNAVTYRLFTGNIERWPQEWDLPKYAEVPVTAVDALESLRAGEVVLTSAPQELSGARVGRILDGWGWPAADRAVDAGQSFVQGGDYSGSALELMNETAVTTEDGVVFVDGAGLVTFRDRHRRWQPPSNVSQATFGDAGAELGYTMLKGDYDNDPIRNEARITAQGGVEQVSLNTTSRDAYGLRTTSRNVLLVSDTEAATMADYLVSRYKDPQLRFPAIGLKPQADDLIWPQALGREIGDRITVKRRPQGIGTAISIDQHVEGIEHTGTPKHWDTRWLLSPAVAYQAWLLGDSTYGVLGTTTILGY